MTFAPAFIVPLTRWPIVNDQVAVFLRVGDAEFEAVTDDDAGVADLAARFGIKRRAIEDDLHRVVVADFGQLVEQMVLGDDAADFGGRFGRFIAEKLGDS